VIRVADNRPEDRATKVPNDLRAAFGYALARFQGQHRTRFPTPGALAQYLAPRTVQTPALDLIDAELVRAASTPDARLIISMPPQEGKSQRASRRFPLWVLIGHPDTRVVIASYEHNVARRWGRAIRDDIIVHGRDFGLQIRPDLAAQNEWQLLGYEGGVFATGIGGALTGRPADVMIIDDPLKGREEADSEVYRERCWDWWLETASTRLAPGAPVIMILTRWHHDDLAGRMLAAEDGHLWRVLNIPAQAEHRPEKGETDPLGREPGEFMISARGRTQRQWEAIKTRSLGRTWTALYQGRPSPDAGGLFPADEDWARYEQPLWIERPDGSKVIPDAHRDDVELAQSWDMSFKDTKGSDYVVGQVWMRRGIDAYLLDQVRDRLSFTGTYQTMRTLSAK